MRISNHRETIKEMKIYGSLKENVVLSVVVVTYNANIKLINCLRSLTNQTIEDFEIIVVDNGNNEMAKEELNKFNLKYILLNKNYGPSFGRNVGTYYSRGRIVIFIDDDAVIKNDCLESHFKFYADNNVYAVRGRVFALSGKIYTYTAGHYNLGDNIQKKADFDIEGNLSLRKDILVKVDGFDPQIFGGEGHDLRTRILEVDIDENAFIYSPHAIIYHDFADSLKKFIKKAIRYGEKKGMLEQKNGKRLFLGSRMIIQKL